MAKRKRQITPARLGKLWAAYTEFQTPRLAPSTIKRDYHKVARIITKMPRSLTTAIEIRQWIIGTYSAESTRRLLQQLNACCDWALEDELIGWNPFLGLGKRLKRIQGDSTWAAFSKAERAAIIDRFTEVHPQYLPWVQFLFLTGCRPEEAAALQWLHVTPAPVSIHIRCAAPVGIGEVQRTKNRKERYFMAGPQLQALLNSLRPDGGDREARIFNGLKGGPFEYHNFNTRFWKPTLEALVEEGQVFRYLSQYHCRHTWITLALESGLPIAKVAYYVGTSAQVIMKHYAAARPSEDDKLEF